MVHAGPGDGEKRAEEILSLSCEKKAKSLFYVADYASILTSCFERSFGKAGCYFEIY